MAPQRETLDERTTPVSKTNPASTIRGIRVAVDGTLTDVELPNDGVLDALYHHIDCRNVDVVRLRSDLDMWIDGEGALVEAAPNVVASWIAVVANAEEVSLPYFGNVVFLSVDQHGNSRTLAEGADNFVHLTAAHLPTDLHARLAR